MNSMPTKKRIVATSGSVRRRVKTGMRCVCSVREMPNVVVMKVMSGDAMEGGSSRGRRVT